MHLINLTEHVFEIKYSYQLEYELMNSSFHSKRQTGRAAAVEGG